MNWKLRLQNKTTLIALLTSIVALVYQILGVCGIVPGISEDSVLTIAGIGVNILCMLGIVVDPTTKGISDSQRAKGYNTPSIGEE